MQKLFCLLVVAAAVLTSCGDKQLSTAEATSSFRLDAEVKTIDDILKRYEEPSQFFTISSDTLSRIQGEQGTVIFIDPNDLTSENGQLIGKTIIVELKELLNQKQLLMARAQTVSDKKLLISGGAYFINMTSEGQQLKLKNGKTLNAQFPKISNNEMALFYGQRDSLGLMNWKQAGESFNSKESMQTDASTSEKGDLYNMGMERAEGSDFTELDSKTYKIIGLNALGWINCDRFIDIANKTDLIVDIVSPDSIRLANVFLVFKDINSVMQLSYQNGINKFEDIPVGSNVRIIAYTVKDKKTYARASDITIKDKGKEKLYLKETDDSEFKKMLQD